MYRFILAAIFLFPPSSLFSQTIETHLSSAVEAYVGEKGFSGTILVAKEGQPILHQSYGLAYYATPDTLENNYHYAMASITKLFTSIRILQLVEAGRLGLDSAVIDYLPGFKDHISRPIKIHHLLLHLSGLPEERDKLYRRHHSPKEMLDEVLSYPSKNQFGRFNYNNIDYILLGLIIEKLSGRSWEEEIEGAILQPLEMTETGFLAYGDYPCNFAYSYSKKWYGMVQDPLFYIENFFAAGSMYSSSGDLLKLDQALYGEHLLKERGKALLNQYFPEYKFAAYGVWNYDYPFVAAKPRIMERRGKILGANVVLVRIPEDHFTLIILSNDDRFNPDSFGDEGNLREILIRALYDSTDSGDGD